MDAARLYEVVKDVPTEEECFRACGLVYVPPEKRDAVVEHRAKARSWG